MAVSLRDKDQQIKLLIKERDEQKFQAELMAKRAQQWEEKFNQSELEKSQVTSEADDEVVELRRLAQELEDENKKLAEKLISSEQVLSDAQFKYDELECERSELRKELEDKEDLLKSAEMERAEMLQGKPGQQIITERSVSKAKLEREIEELKEKLVGKDEQMMQLRSSLEMRKNEVANLQSHSADLERKLKIESERSERHLKRIDEINLELKAGSAKLATKIEENEIYEKQVRQLRQELRAAEEKLEQVSLARKKDVDILHNKLSAARRGSTTPTSPQPYKTPTPQDEIVRLQMELRDLKDQLIDREAELDCNRRDLEVMRRKMETRTLEVDCNNQELARRCQDLLEQNRQSEDTVKQLLKSTTEHSAQLMRATDDLKEANGKCVKLRDEINELEGKLEEQMKRGSVLSKENSQLKDENEEYKEQIELLRQQVDSLNGQLSELCEQLDVQTNCLHKDREALANQLSEGEIELAQVRHDLGTAKQDMRTCKLQTQEVISERDRLRSDLEMREQYIASRNDIIETLRHELEDCKKSLAEHKQKIEDLREAATSEADQVAKEMKAQLGALRRDCQVKNDDCLALQNKCEQLQKQLSETQVNNEEEELKRFDEMRQKHSAELDVLKLRLKDLEEQLEEARSSTLKRDNGTAAGNRKPASSLCDSQVTTNSGDSSSSSSIGGSKSATADQAASKHNIEEYESQIEFLNSLVVDMQRKCDDYKSRLAQIETINIMNEFDNLILSNQPHQMANSRASTLRRDKPPQAVNSSVNGPKTASNGGATATNTLTRSTDTTGQANKRSSIHNNNNQLDYFSDAAGNIDKPTTRISGRPFCDICNVYDLHHTVYCPKISEKLALRAQMLDSGNNNYIGANNNNSITSMTTNDDVGNDDLFREYELSLQHASVRPYASLRRPQALDKPPRPYCDHCDLFGHTIKSCNSLKI